MNQAALRCRMNFPHLKSCASPVKGDMFGSMKPDILEEHSVNSSPLSKSPSDILGELTSRISKSPRKKLYCPPVIEPLEAEKQKEKEIGFLFSNITCTSRFDQNIPDFLKDFVVYAYKGSENQEIAWADFKKTVNIVKECVISCANMSFFLNGDEVKCKAHTGSAQRKLDQIADDFSNISLDKVIGLIDELVSCERLSIFSSDRFHYSVVTPLIIQSSEIDSSNGKLFRISVNGYVFPSIADLIERGNPGSVIKKITMF